MELSYIFLNSSVLYPCIVDGVLTNSCPCLLIIFRCVKCNWCQAIVCSKAQMRLSDRQQKLKPDVLCSRLLNLLSLSANDLHTVRRKCCHAQITQAVVPNLLPSGVNVDSNLMNSRHPTSNKVNIGCNLISLCVVLGKPNFEKSDMIGQIVFLNRDWSVCQYLCSYQLL